MSVIPKPGTSEYQWWLRGARDEAEAINKGITENGRKVYDAVHVLAQQGAPADQITRWVALVFTADWSWRRRAKLAWELVESSRTDKLVLASAAVVLLSALYLLAHVTLWIVR